MNDKIKNSSLILAYQQDSSTIPSDFTITCLLSTKPKGIFQRSFQIDNLIVCGTNQGPIILAGLNKNENKFQRVSLLCGHSYKITDIKETLQGDSFLSISANCTICLWSLFDGSCLFYSDLLLPINDYHLSISPSRINQIFIWAAGSNLYLFDFETEKIVYSLNIGGLNNFSILSPHTSYCVSSTIAVCSSVTKLMSYTINDDQTLNLVKEIPTPEFFGRTIKVCQRGVIQYCSSTGNWSIIRPKDSAIVLSGSFKIDRDDFISDVTWNSLLFFCMATFKARFMAVTMKKSSDFNTNTSKITIVSRKIIQCDSFLSQFSFCLIGNDEVAFSPDTKSVVVLSEKSQFVLKPKKSKKQFNIIESDFSQPYVVYSNGKSTISFYNARIQTSDIQRYTFNGKITTIYARNSNMPNSVQIINGYDDGRISFWTVGTDIKKAITVSALLSPINKLIELPFRFAGRQLLLAISDTECCLLKTTDIYLIFNLGSTFSILSVYYINKLNYLVIELSNGCFAVFNLIDPNPILLLSQLPQGSILLYSNFFSFFIKNITSMVCLRLSNRSLWYQFLDISRIHSIELSEEDDQVHNSLNFIDQLIYKDSKNIKTNINRTKKDQQTSVNDSKNKISTESKSKSTIKSNTDNSSIKPDSNTSISKTQSLISDDDKDDTIYSSLVIIGKENKPTFFYPHYSINLENVLYSSPVIAAKHFLIKRLIAKMKSIDDISYKEDSKQFVDFVPILIKIMYETPDDSEIQQICVETCASLNFLITFIKAQNFVSPLLMQLHYKDINNYAKHELLMMSLFTARFHNLIPAEILPDLLHFLLSEQKKNKNKSSAISAMATFILIDGIHIWLKVLNEQSIYSKSDADTNNSDSSSGASSTSSSSSSSKKKNLKKMKNDENLYLSIIKSVIINKRQFKFLYNRFLSYIYSVDISLLIDILPKFVKKCYTGSNTSSPAPISIQSNQKSNKLAEAALDLYSEMELKNDELLSGWLSVAIVSVASKFTQLSKKATELIKKHSKLLPYVNKQNKTLIIGTSSGSVYVYNNMKLKTNLKLFNDKIELVSVGPNEECGLAIAKFENSGKIFKVKASNSVIHVMEIFRPPKGTKFSINWLKNDNASISFVPSNK